VSPSLGGILYDNLGYEALFIAVFALIALDVCLRLVMIEKKVAVRLRQPLVPDGQAKYGTFQPNKIDITSQDQLCIGTCSDSEASSPTENSPPLTPTKAPPQASTTAAHPLVILIKSPRILTSMYGALVTVTVLVAFDAALPIFVEKQFGWSSTGGGLIFLAITLPIFAAPVAGRLSDKYPSSYLTALWFAISAGMTCLLLFVVNEGLSPFVQKILLCALLTLYGKSNILNVSSTSSPANTK
jgi:nitrate/nitrite transporter NarK